MSPEAKQILNGEFREQNLLHVSTFISFWKVFLRQQNRQAQLRFLIYSEYFIETVSSNPESLPPQGGTHLPQTPKHSQSHFQHFVIRA